MRDRPHQLPISTRHAFALAFDLAVRRDALHSLIVPLVLRAPWGVTLAVLPPLEEATRPQLALTCLALIGDWVTSLVIGAMLRFRAQSVFNTPRRVRPAPASQCYARGLARLPWLVVTEAVRNFSFTLAGSFSILPWVFLQLREHALTMDLGRELLLLMLGIFLSLPALFLFFRLALATEAVVLHEPDMAGAFVRSFRMMRGRFERWLELIAASVVLALVGILLMAIVSLAVPALSTSTLVAVGLLLLTIVMPVIQYAWTFFYLRLVEIDEPAIEVGPTYALRSGESRQIASTGAPKIADRLP
jgi:hypothetical protein